MAPESHEQVVPETYVSGTTLETNGLVKSFGETRALTDGTIDLLRGEVVALMGENGSGKSTLVKLISGVLHPNAGTIKLDDEPIRLGSPRQALDQGIVTVFQEILVAPTMSVADNVCLGSMPLRDTSAARAERRRHAREALERLTAERFDLDVPIGSLGLMQQQLCVIARAIARKPKVLVLDESTSTLDVTVRDRLFATIRELCDLGVGVLFISHRMGEVMSLADRIVVLRGGKTVGSMNRAEVTPDEVVKMMSGESYAIGRTRRQRTLAGGPPLLAAERVQIAEDFPPIDLEVGAGEIVGLAGLEGQGQEAFIKTLAGIQRLTGGTIEHRCGGEPRQVTSYHRAVRDGIVYVPRDRKNDGLAGVLSTVDNFAMPTYGRDAHFGIFRRSRTIRRLDEFRRRLAFVVPVGKPSGRLSGGTQQKVVIARWLALNPRVVLLNDPTRGVDHATKLEIYDLLEELSESGVAVVMVSTEVEEHLALMDRVLVFRGGGVTAEYRHGEVDRDGLVAAFFGHVAGEQSSGAAGSRADDESPRGASR